MKQKEGESKGGVRESEREREREREVGERERGGEREVVRYIRVSSVNKKRKGDSVHRWLMVEIPAIVLRVLTIAMVMVT